MSTSLDEELIVLEGLDFDITCNSRIAGCDKKAVWLATARCCSTDWYACAQHRLELLAFLREKKYVKCRPCGYSYEPAKTINIDWTKL
jgi:hypothetical protein